MKTLDKTIMYLGEKHNKVIISVGLVHNQSVRT